MKLTNLMTTAYNLLIGYPLETGDYPSTTLLTKIDLCNRVEL